MIRLFSIFLAFSLAVDIHGQTAADVLRYSRTFVGGTARTMAVGGAFGALGADFAMLSVNPAGLGVYRSSEFSITPGYQFQRIETVRGGEPFNNSFSKFNLNSAGVVFDNLSNSEESALKALNFAVGFNRLAIFDGEFVTSEASARSLLERFLVFTNDGNAGLFGSQLALDTDLIFPIDPMSANCPCTIDILEGDLVQKNLDFFSKGAIDEIVLSAGLNYDHRLYVGATIGIPIINYEQRTTYTETDDNAQIPFFNSLRFEEEFSTTGAGANLKLGFIYRVNRKIRAGLAVHTPTVYTLTDDFRASMESSITYNEGDPPTIASSSSPIGEYGYDVKTPWKVIASGVLILRKIGFISLDVEWVNYGNAKLRVDLETYPDDLPFEESVNTAVNATYRHTFNVRAGIEHTIKLFRFRGGYAFYSQPYRSSVNDFSAHLHRFSAGLGYRQKVFAIDLTLIQEMTDDIFVKYEIPGSNYQYTSDLGISKMHVLASLSFKF
ncbi:MAG: hypothetical protein AAF502_05140 [Bacteroidota bacterium]